MHEHCIKEIPLCINAYKYDKNYQKLLSLHLNYCNGQCQLQLSLFLTAYRDIWGRENEQWL